MFFFFTLIILGIVFFVSFSNAYKIIKQDLSLRLRDMASVSALQISAEDHASLKVPSDEDSQVYKNIKETLKKIRNNSTDITYIYTLRENENGDIAFVVDAEEEIENVSHLGDVYTDANQFLKDNFLTINSPVVEKEFSTDKWGTWITGYAPFYDKNYKFEGILAMDVSVSDIANNQRKIIILYILTFVLSGLLAAILGIFLSKRLTKSIVSLNDILKNNGDSKDIVSSDDEIGYLANTIKSTLDKVNVDKKEKEDQILDKNKTLEKMNKLMIGRELEMIRLKKEISELKNVDSM
jgi:hypothetical protein